MRTSQKESVGTDRRVSQFLADGHFRLGHYATALVHYIASGDQEAIISCGDECLKVGELEHGIKAYEAVGRVIPSELLVACGDWNSEFSRDKAISAYVMAGAYDKLIDLGNSLLDPDDPRDGPGHFKFATEAYIASGNTEKISTIAAYSLHRGLIEDAYAAYKFIGDNDGLIATGNLAAEKRQENVAIECFEAAGSWQSLNDLGDLCLSRCRDTQAENAYKAAAEVYEQLMPTDA